MILLISAVRRFYLRLLFPLTYLHAIQVQRMPDVLHTTTSFKVACLVKTGT